MSPRLGSPEHGFEVEALAPLTGHVAGWRPRCPRRPERDVKPRALSRTPVRLMAPCGPMEQPNSPNRQATQIPVNCANAANFWIPASGRSRTRTWDLFLIRKTFCRLQSPQLTLNPCKPCQRRRRKTTGDDWPLQAGGPIVAPRPQFEGRVSYGPEADITPTIRSSPDAPEAGRCAPAGSRPGGRASTRRARRSRGCSCPRWRRDDPCPGLTPTVAMPPQQPRLPSYLDLGGAAEKPVQPRVISWQASG
jgi:hypothetical protein